MVIIATPTHYYLLAPPVDDTTLDSIEEGGEEVLGSD